MAVFGSYVYGTGSTYGSAPSTALFSELYMLSETVIEITFSTPIMINDALKDTSNYQIEFFGNAGSTDVEVKRILAGPPEGSPNELKYTSSIYLVTSVHTKGQKYKITISGLTSTLGGVLSSTDLHDTGTRTKVDEILSSIPSHYDKRPESTIRSILTAIGKQDDLIGGSRREEI